MRDADGVIAQRFCHDVDESSIPHFLEFPVKGPDDWARMKERYRLDDPARRIPPERIEEARRAVAAGSAIRMFASGLYGQLRAWMGIENLSYAFYDYPDMIRDMVEHWAEPPRIADR